MLKKTKKALVFGLGLLGGGVATTNWLLKQGYEVTVTDLKDEKTLQPSLKKIKGKVKLALGGHQQKLIEENDLVVVNPDVSRFHPYIQQAEKRQKSVANEATLFYNHWLKKTIGVTGTRGKTTTTRWVTHFLQARFEAMSAGNSYSSPLLAKVDRQAKYDYAVTELPSFLLEFFDQSARGPEVAIVTNLFQDHLNRHGTMQEYARVKTNIFKNQTSSQHLILNADNRWTDFFLTQKPRGQIWFFSLKELGIKQKGLEVKEGRVYFKNQGQLTPLWSARSFSRRQGEHNLQNLLAAALASYLSGISWLEIKKRLTTLPAIEFRQETIYENAKLKIINDTVATSPEGGMAAIKRFASPQTILITGGTDRQLDFSAWAEMVKERISPQNLILLQGSATEKMAKELKKRGVTGQIYDTLPQCFNLALEKAKQYPAALIVFSPAAKSFEKFKNEFDRGRKFNSLVKRYRFFDFKTNA